MLKKIAKIIRKVCIVVLVYRAIFEMLLISRCQIFKLDRLGFYCKYMLSYLIGQSKNSEIEIKLEDFCTKALVLVSPTVLEIF